MLPSPIGSEYGEKDIAFEYNKIPQALIFLSDRMFGKVLARRWTSALVFFKKYYFLKNYYASSKLTIVVLYIRELCWFGTGIKSLHPTKIFRIEEEVPRKDTKYAQSFPRQCPPLSSLQTHPHGLH